MRARDWSADDEWFGTWSVTRDVSTRDPDDVLLPGLTARDFLEFMSRPETPRGSEWLRRVYAHHTRDLHLHVYGRKDHAERRPGILFVHGGAWREGHPFIHVRHAHAFAAMGWVAATVEYRFVSEAAWPGCLEDVGAALGWMQAHADELGLDAERIAIAGGSAGAHLALLTAFNRPRDLRAVIAWYPPTDLRFPGTPAEIRESPAAIAAVFGIRESELDALSPVRLASPGAPPVLTMTGSADLITTAGMIRDFHDVLDRHGVANELHVFEGRGHAFDFFGGDWYACVQHMTRFLVTLVSAA